MKAQHSDGRTFEGDEAEFHRTYGPAGFRRVDEAAPADAKAQADTGADAPESTETNETDAVGQDAADTAGDQPKAAKATAKKAKDDGDK